MPDDVDEVKQELTSKRPKPAKLTAEDFLSTGSTLLNLACSGRAFGGFMRGGYYHFVGDSSSGKSFICLTCMAEATNNPVFDDYQLISDDVEGGQLFDFGRFFGAKMAERVRPPAGTKDNPVNSETVEDFYDYLDSALKRGPCIYVLDSMDSLVPRADLKKYDKQKQGRERIRAGNKPKPGEEAGSYGMAKAKLNSEMIRISLPKIKATRSILVVIGQTRDKVPEGFATPSYGDKTTTGGGRSLKFYAHLQLWSSVQEKVWKVVNDKRREIGIKAQIRVRKNRLTGRDRTAVVPIYHSFGIDDVGSCVDFLLDEGHWGKASSGIKAPEFDFVGSQEKLIRHIEKEDGERELRILVAKVWKEIEIKAAVERKPRYD